MALKYIAVPGKWWVATYGDLGLEVTFFDDPLAYGRAIKAAEDAHRIGDFDTYTYGNATIGKFVEECTEVAHG